MLGKVPNLFRGTTYLCLFLALTKSENDKNYISVSKFAPNQ